MKKKVACYFRETLFSHKVFLMFIIIFQPDNMIWFDNHHLAQSTAETYGSVTSLQQQSNREMIRNQNLPVAVLGTMNICIAIYGHIY